MCSCRLGFSNLMVCKIPDKIVQMTGKALGSLFYLVDARHRRIVRRNIKFAIPEMGASEIRDNSKRVFQNAAISFLEIIQMSRMSAENILKRVSIKGGEHLLEAKHSKAGAIVISAHFGNWEMAHVFGSCFLKEPLVLVARKIRPSKANDWLNRLRGRFGSEVLDKNSALPKMIRALRTGRILGLLVDQGTLLSDGVEIEFFGKKTNATPAAAVLARRYRVPVIPVFCYRREDGTLQIEVREPLKLQETEDYQSDIQRNTQIMMDSIERVIRQHPDQWFWFHKRWKRHYPELYPEDIARRKKKKRKRRLREAKSR